MDPSACALCSTVSELCFEEYASDTLVSAPFPPAVHQFQRYFLDDGLFACPACLTFYWRDSDSFTVANGPRETTVTLKRLSDADAETVIAAKEKSGGRRA